MIPSYITSEHLVEAICRIRREGVPPRRKGRHYCLVKDGCHYPPKYTVALAHQIATGRFLPSYEFSGGGESNGFLSKRGFEIADCNCGGGYRAKTLTRRANRTRKRKSAKGHTRHSEHCPDCKARVRELLERIYGECVANHGFNWPTHPSSYSSTPINLTLRNLAAILEDYRGHEFNDFVKSDTLATCDFWVPDPGFILEFDERQHFTTPRKLALSAYPDDLALGFSKEQWISQCERHDAKDNDPPFRDEQRAWYDALRDLVPTIKGLQPTVRLYARDMVWCSLDPDSNIDQQRFSAFIGHRSLTQKPLRTSQTMIKRHNSAAGKTPVLRAALVFPEVEDHVQKPAIPTHASFAGESVDFVLFPEAYISASDSKRINSLKKLAADLDSPLLVGATDSSVDSTGRTRQVLQRIDPDRSHSRIYVKHSTACAVAFESPDWSPHVMLPTFDLVGVRAGATICHDQYLGLLPRFLAKRGARIWINPSYYNVVDIKWSSILRLRAVENRVFALCTLHHRVKKGATRTHPFAFSPDGNELRARKAGTRNSLPLSKCTESDTVYIVDLDMGLLDGELVWGRIPRAEDLPRPRPQNPPNSNPKMPIRVRLIDEGLAVFSRSRWRTVDDPGCALETDQGSVYVGVVQNEQMLDATECFRVIDRAKKANSKPIIWNVWDELPTDSARLATLMLGRTIECCAPILISDRNRIHELVELSNNNKVPTRRTIEASGEAIVDLGYAWGLDSAFKMVTACVSRDMRAEALDRYRTLT